MDIKKNIGIKIRVLRKQKGLSQAKLAELIERSTEAVSNLERGESLPSIDTLIRLSDKLDVPTHYFFEGAASDNVGNWRMEKVSELISIAYGLSDKELELAVNQMKAFK